MGLCLSRHEEILIEVALKVALSEMKAEIMACIREEFTNSRSMSDGSEAAHVITAAPDTPV